jgi:hypothetical protein
MVTAYKMHFETSYPHVIQKRYIGIGKFATHLYENQSRAFTRLHKVLIPAFSMTENW